MKSIAIFIFGLVITNAAILNFEIEDEWNNVLGTGLMHRDEIPQHISDVIFDAENEMNFIVYTRANPGLGDGQVVVLGDIESLMASNFNPEHPTRFTIHGWYGSTGENANVQVHNNYFQIGDYNCITVDWTRGAHANYITARNNVPLAGRNLARFIDFLVQDGGQNSSQIVITGFSLGGQVAGLAGKHTTTGLVQSIISMDPAMSLFYASNANDRVDSSDAEYVELIITSGGDVGMLDPVGHANFYPNGGNNQPGCDSCSHARAVDYFVESLISPAGFWGNRCDGSEDLGNLNCTGVRFAMGGEPTLHGTGAEGTFYLETAGSSPFALG